MSSHEGRADAAGNQLELWAEPGAPPMLGLRVLRRDGRESAFDLGALADSIRRAGWPGESLDGDTARSLARAVRLYLQQTPQPIAIDTVRETVERLLIEMGYTLSARMYAGAFAPPALGEQHTSAAGMFNEALPMDRVERFLAAAAADAGLSRETADDVLALVLHQIRAAGVQHLTPSLLREWMRSELHARGLMPEASRLARLSLPVSALHDAFVENDRPPHAAPADPESVALALAQRVSGAYVLGQLLPSAAGQAHLRGDIQVRGIGNFLRLDSAQLDTRRLRVDSAKHFVTQLTTQTDALSRFFGGELSWPAINFALAPAIADMPDAELQEFVHALLASTETFASRTATERATMTLGFAWDAPAGFSTDAHDERVPADAIYSAARRIFVAALDTLAESTKSRTTSASIAIHVSPYFFGGPDAHRTLEVLGRIATTMPIALHYDAAAPDLFAGFEPEPAETVIAQTVTIPVARAARISANREDFLARLESLVTAAAAAHRAKHDFLQRVYAERGGPLNALRSDSGTMTDPRRMHYRIAAKDAGVAALERAGAAWIGPAEALGVAEAALQHLRDACLRESAATDLRFMLADSTASRSLLRVLDRRPARHDTHAVQLLSAECRLHSLFDEPPFFTVSGESFASAHETAAFIRHAFLHSPCRALRIL